MSQPNVHPQTSSNEPTVVLSSWHGPWPDDDRDANFKHDVALYSKLDPLETLGNLSEATGIPVGSLCRYILAKWAAAGAEALMTLGPTAITRMTDAVAAAEASDSDDERLATYRDITAQLSWLRAPLDDPELYD
ncbi:MAG: hypothetical protein ACI8TP_002198 [Acidimicrobiales bacterium]